MIAIIVLLILFICEKKNANEEGKLENMKIVNNND